MKKLTLVLLLALLSACAKVEAQDLNFIKARNSLSKRVNGLMLTIDSAELQDRKLLVSWSLSYNGPRDQIYILEPSLKRAIFDQTSLSIFTWSKRGRHEMKLSGAAVAGKYYAPREWFVRIEKNRSVQGKITVDLAQKRNKFTPSLSKTLKSPPLWVQLVHRPTDRAESLELDAWTGEAFSKLVYVKP